MAKPIPALRNLKAAQVAVSSPVADYVKNNPAPHLVRCSITIRICDGAFICLLFAFILKFRNVVAKEAIRPLDSTLMEVNFVSTLMPLTLPSVSVLT